MGNQEKLDGWYGGSRNGKEMASDERLIDGDVVRGRVRDPLAGDVNR